jgi:hypothetical protein
MCGYSKAAIGDTEISLAFGAYGGALCVGGECYDNRGYGDEHLQNLPGARAKVASLLGQFTKEQLIELFLDLADNGDEG